MMMVIIMIQRNRRTDGRRHVEGRAICQNVACVVIILNSGPMRCGTHKNTARLRTEHAHGTRKLICNARGERVVQKRMISIRVDLPGDFTSTLWCSMRTY